MSLKLVVNEGLFRLLFIPHLEPTPIVPVRTTFRPY